MRRNAERKQRKLAKYLKRREEQEQAAASLQAIEEEMQEPYALTEADKKAIDRGIEAARKGEFATDQEVEAVFAKYRQA